MHRREFMSWLVGAVAATQLPALAGVAPFASRWEVEIVRVESIRATSQGFKFVTTSLAKAHCGTLSDARRIQTEFYESFAQHRKLRCIVRSRHTTEA